MPLFRLILLFLAVLFIQPAPLGGTSNWFMTGCMDGDFNCDQTVDVLDVIVLGSITALILLLLGYGQRLKVTQLLGRKRPVRLVERST